MEHRLETPLAHSMPAFDAEIVRLMDVQGLVWPLSFWKEVCRQYQCKGRAPNSIVDPVSGYVNSYIVERMDLQITKHNSLLTLTFVAILRHRAIEISSKTTIKK